VAAGCTDDGTSSQSGYFSARGWPCVENFGTRLRVFEAHDSFRDDDAHFIAIPPHREFRAHCDYALVSCTDDEGPRGVLGDFEECFTSRQIDPAFLVSEVDADLACGIERDTGSVSERDGC